MIDIVSRGLRVRDDGTGTGRERDGTLAEFADKDAIILLGDPGMGKTTLLRTVANGRSTTVRGFLIDPPAITGEPLFLDALDEHRILAGGQDASSELAKVLCTLHRPKFRLSCRAADWFGSRDHEAFKTASASGRLVILELRPLSGDEILHAVQGKVPDPALFLAEVKSAGLSELLGNPQTLELLALAWGTEQRPRNKFEAYQLGVSELLKETNNQHLQRGVTSQAPRELRRAAGAACSVILLANSLGLSRIETAEGDGYLSPSVVPHADCTTLDAMLKRRLFASSETDRFEPIHRTIAEFLAAEDLCQRIAHGLPIERVMALICGVDGKPVASLRGLFAWLMCRLGHRAEDHVKRAPYAVATYGDASELTPSAQQSLWLALRQLRDPWFLVNDDDRGSFRGLANQNTAHILHEFIEDPTTGVHLKIAALEAIAHSTEEIGLSPLVRTMVLANHNNTWLRTTALKAFAHLVGNDWPSLKALDCALAQASDDLTAPEVRVKLLLLTQSCGRLPQRMISIMEQAASAKKETHTIGYFYPLLPLPSADDLDLILDNAARVLVPKTEQYHEFHSLIKRWLQRRLESPAPIAPAQLIRWLRRIKLGSKHDSQETLASLKARFTQYPLYFDEIFDLLLHSATDEDRSFNSFTADLLRLFPASVWPLPPCEIFLTYAEKEPIPERAADLFGMYLSWFPVEGASIALMEAGFAFIDDRPDVAKALGNWRSCTIDQWRTEEWEGEKTEGRKHAETRAQNVSDLTPRLSTLRAGGEEQTLAWTAMAYKGGFYDLNDIPGGRERLVSLTNEEIADALIEGFIRYLDNPAIPTKGEVIERWQAHSIPYTHALLSLSVFLRHSAGMSVPPAALPSCLAAVATTSNHSDQVPDYDETLSAWLFHEVRHNPTVVQSVLLDLWSACSTKKRNDLPRFYELSQDPGCQPLLTSLSADLLRSGINDNPYTVGKLVPVLLRHDRQAALAIGNTEVARHGVSEEVRAIWGTALFMIDQSNFLDRWKVLISVSDAALWAAIDLIERGYGSSNGGAALTSAQRTEIITAVGKRFANIGHPSRGWSGSHNPWDASDLVSNQIKLLAADGSADVDAQLERLEQDNNLASYRDIIRHHRAQHQKQQRESSFTFATAEEVAQAINNQAPATPLDLLAFIVDHLGALSRELTHTQRERYRAYWNEKDRKLVKPKREESCSGFLAEDLLHKVQAQGLIVTTEYHMVAAKKCDLVVLQGNQRLLPIEVKHHYHGELWTAWRTQLDRLYCHDAKAAGLGIYLVLWSGEATGRKMPKLPEGIIRPNSATELGRALVSLIPEKDRQRLKIVVVDISGP